MAQPLINILKAAAAEKKNDFKFHPITVGLLCKDVDVTGIATSGGMSTTTYYIRVVHDGKKFELVHYDIHNHGWDHGPWLSVETIHAIIDKLEVTEH